VVGGWPIGTLVANLVGAFALGILLEGLSRVGPETPGRRLVRLGVGTGLLGGFTTFSSLALEIERLLADGELGIAVGYAVVTIVLGVVVTVAGVLLAGRLPWGGSR
jgi:fluoride exporter